VRIAILTCRQLPKFITWEIPDADELFADDRRLIAEFARRGVSAEAVSWGDPDIDWNTFDIALIRSTWDYIDAREEFIEAMWAIDNSSCRLINPVETVRWNSHKGYLVDPFDPRTPTVPTYRADRADPAELRDVMDRGGWRDVVIKPIVGAAGFGVRRVSLDDMDGQLEQLRTTPEGGYLIVQPLIESVKDEGELSFIFFDRRFSHLVRKRPAAGDYRINPVFGGIDESGTPRPGDVAQAEAILARIPYKNLYARLDLVRINGRLAVMEIEMIEPFLYFDHFPASVARFADVVLGQATSGA